jgi:hypothetical protein
MSAENSLSENHKNLKEYTLSGGHLPRRLDTRKSMVVQDNFYSSITKPHQAFYLTAPDVSLARR